MVYTFPQNLYAATRNLRFYPDESVDPPRRPVGKSESSLERTTMDLPIVSNDGCILELIYFPKLRDDQTALLDHRPPAFGVLTYGPDQCFRGGRRARGNAIPYVLTCGGRTPNPSAIGRKCDLGSVSVRALLSAVLSLLAGKPRTRRAPLQRRSAATPAFAAHPFSLSRSLKRLPKGDLSWLLSSFVPHFSPLS